MSAHEPGPELTPGDIADARAVARKLRASGYLRIASHDVARYIERLADAYERLSARHGALVASLTQHHGGEPLDQGGGA